MELLFDCECGNKFVLGVGIIKEVKTIIDGQSIWIKYYDCPYCGKRFYGQVDDEVSRRMLTDLTKSMATMAKKKQGHKELSKKQLVKASKLKNNLLLYRNNLKTKYNGIVVDKKLVHFNLDEPFK